MQGAVPRPDGTIYLTYGAADRCIGAASIETAEIVDALCAAASSRRARWSAVISAIVDSAP